MHFHKEYHPHIPRNHSKAYRGVVITLFGWFLAADQTAIIKEVYTRVSSSVIFFILFLSVFVFLSIFIIITKQTSYLKPVKIKVLFLRCIVSVVSYFAYIISGLWNSLADNSLLLNTEAVFVPFVLRFFRGQVIKRAAFLGILLGFIGVAFIAVPTKGMFNPGAWIGLLSGLGIAIGIYLTSVTIKTEPPLRIGFYHALLALILATPSAIAWWQMPSYIDIFYIATAGFFLCIALYLFFEAFYYTEAHVIGMLSYSLVIFSGILEWWLWGIVPHTQSMMGFLLIFLGGMIVINSYRDMEKKKTGMFL